MQRFGSIYKITNIVNGQSYIGKTTRPLKERLANHKHHGKTNSNRNAYLYNSINLHGWDNFKKEEIVVCLTNDRDLDDLEVFFIKYFDTFNNGYNLTTGGDINPMFGKHHSEDSRKKISASNTGKHTGSKNPMFGVKRTQESIQKQKNNSEHYKKIICIETNQLFESIADASVFTADFTKTKVKDPSKAYSGSISEVLNGDRWHSKGFTFRVQILGEKIIPVDFIDIEEKIKANYVLSRNRNSEVTKNKMRNGAKKIKIICNENGKIYESMSEASRDLGILVQNIYRNLQGIVKKTKGYTFTFVRKI